MLDRQDAISEDCAIVIKEMVTSKDTSLTTSW